MVLVTNESTLIKKTGIRIYYNEDIIVDFMAGEERKVVQIPDSVNKNKDIIAVTLFFSFTFKTFYFSTS